MFGILIATYGAVFVAESVGDKLLYTTGVLSTRYRTAPVLIGMMLAFMAKMAVAVAVGKAISELPPVFVAVLTSLSFIGVAITLWRKPDEPREKKREHSNSKAAMVSFAAIFFSEWGDVGQITAAAMAARFGAPLLVWCGGSAAIALGLPLERSALTVLVLVAALPSASNVSLLAERFGADNGRIARIILVSTACAFVTFSLAVTLLV